MTLSIFTGPSHGLRAMIVLGLGLIFTAPMAWADKPEIYTGFGSNLAVGG